MSQASTILANVARSVFRTNLNSALAAMASLQKGGTAPTAPNGLAAGWLWLEDDNPSSTVWTLRIYDGADWITIGTVDSTNNLFNLDPSFASDFLVRLVGGSAGGRFALQKGSSGNSLGGNVTIDISGNLVRLYENGGSNRGAYLDITETAGSQASRLWHDGNLSLVGQVAFFPVSSAPSGFLKANGAAVSRTTYAALFALIGTTFGAGDGSTTFNLPDLRGEFIRAYDDGRGVDQTLLTGTRTASSAVITGLSRTDFMVAGMGVSGTGIPGGATIASVDSGSQITLSSSSVTGSGSTALTFTGRKFGSAEPGQIESHGHNYDSAGNSFFMQRTSGGAVGLTGGSTLSVSQTGVQATGGPETRPRNISLLACIKY